MKDKMGMHGHDVGLYKHVAV